MKKITIVGAGPGGLLAAALFSSNYEVEVYEKETKIGGRSSSVKVDDLIFTAGPTFISKIDVVEQLLMEDGIKLSNYVNYYKLDNLYDIYKNNKKYSFTKDIENNANVFAKDFGNEYRENYLKFIKDNRKKFNVIEPILMNPFNKKRYLSKDFFKLLLELRPHLNMDQYLKRYFPNESARNLMQFQSKYLGMSPHEAPSMFSILSYMEHDLGIYYVEGGVQALMEALYKIAKEKGAKFILNTEVKDVKSHKQHVEFNVNNQKYKTDYLIMNGDLAYNILNNKFKVKERKYAESKIKERKFSCSTIVYYIKLNAEVNLSTHTIILSDNYNEYLKSMESKKLIESDLSMYLYQDQKHKNGVYLLVPVGNLKYQQKLDEKEILEKALQQIKQKTQIDLTKKVDKYKYNTPEKWEQKYNHYLGANFNFGHQIKQMLTMRPNNLQGHKNIIVVGGSTHPGSGLPTIFASVKIAKKLIEKD